MPTDAQKKAIAGVGSAFAGAPASGLSDSQKAAAAGVQAAFAPTPPAPKPPSEPAVISSSSIDDLNAQNATKLASLSGKGSTVGADGNAYDASGSMMSAPEGASYNEGTGQWEYAGKSYGVSDFYGNDGDGDWAAVQKLFAPLQASLDASTLGSVNAIQQSFGALKADQEAYNAAAEKGRSRALLLGGSSRYAPLSAASNVLSQTSYGLRQLANLDAQENAAISQAKAAQQSGDMQLMDKAITMAEGIRKDKQARASDIMAQIQTANKAMAAAHAQAQRDESVADLMSQGVTDPGDILKALNAQGGDFSADEVAKAVKNLAPAHSADGIYKFSNENVGKMLAAGMNANQIQATQDYYNGNGDAPPLSGAQQAAVRKALGGTVAAGAKEFKFTPTQVSELLSGNFTQTDVQNMQADVAVHGIDAVVADMPAAQAALVKRVLANADTVAAIGSDETTLTREKLSEIYGIPDDEDTDGIFGTGESHSAQLDSLESTVERYKDYYSDKEILQMIQKQTDQ